MKTPLLSMLACRAALTFACELSLATSAQAEVTITFGGDLNCNASRVAPKPEGAYKNGRLYPFRDLFSGVQPLLDGEINFANLETTVSDRSNLPDTGGEYVFVSHPNALRAAVGAGINLFNLSNNHLGDHALTGIEETLNSLDQVSRERPMAYTGIARDRDSAIQPTVMEVRVPQGRYRVAIIGLTALSNAPSQAGSSRAGTLYFRNPGDRHQALSALAATQADFKIVSIHGGTENVAKVDAGESAAYRAVLAEGDADLILGHHPHRARAVEQVGHKLIFYSLGNFLMLGAADLTSYPMADNYGLFGKLHLSWDPSMRRLVAKAVEAIPLTQMQIQPHPFSPSESVKRVAVLNQAAMSQLSPNGVVFQMDARGFGVKCLGDHPEARAARVCQASNGR